MSCVKSVCLAGLLSQQGKGIVWVALMPFRVTLPANSLSERHVDAGFSVDNTGSLG